MTAFLVIPAIDLRGGQCVRLAQGRFAEETIYSSDPVAVARRWESEGAKRIHVVDLDGARDGTTPNGDLIAWIAGAIGIPIQMGGGLRTEESVQQMLEAGVDRVVLGTRACREPEFARRMIDLWGERIVIGLDAREGNVAVEGWQGVSARNALDVAREMERFGARRIVFTDIARDGMLTGPNLQAMQEMTAAVRLPVIASGGVSCAADISALAAIPGLEGVIVGRALYEGRVTLAEAINAADSVMR